MKKLVLLLLVLVSLSFTNCRQPSNNDTGDGDGSGPGPDVDTSINSPSQDDFIRDVLAALKAVQVNVNGMDQSLGYCYPNLTFIVNPYTTEEIGIVAVTGEPRQGAFTGEGQVPADAKRAIENKANELLATSNFDGLLTVKVTKN